MTQPLRAPFFYIWTEHKPLFVKFLRVKSYLDFLILADRCEIKQVEKRPTCFILKTFNALQKVKQLLVLFYTPVFHISFHWLLQATSCPVRRKFSDFEMLWFTLHGDSSWKALFISGDDQHLLFNLVFKLRLSSAAAPRQNISLVTSRRARQ